MSQRFDLTGPMVQGTDKRLSRTMKAINKDIALHGAAVGAAVAKEMMELEARGRLVDTELALNAAVSTAAARNEMMVAERLMQVAGQSVVKQQIVADRLNRLMQTDDRTLGRQGF